MPGVLCKLDLEKTYDHFNWILFALPAGNVWIWERNGEYG